MAREEQGPPENPYEDTLLVTGTPEPSPPHGDPDPGETPEVVPEVHPHTANAQSDVSSSHLSRTRRPRFRDRPPFWWLAALGAVISGAGQPGASTRASVPRYSAAQTPAAQSGAPVQAGIMDNVRRNRLDALVALVAAVVIIFVVVSRGQHGPSTSNTGPSSSVVPTVALPALAFAPIAGDPITVTHVLGSGMPAPHDAIAIPGGNYTTDNPDSGQVVLFNARGARIKTITQGSVPLHQPYGLAPAPGGFYVLEAQSGTIDLFASSGRFLHQVLQAAGLRIGRSLFAAPNGTLYVANPASNAVVVIGANGAIVRQITSALSAAPGSFNQVSDAVADANGDIYLVDNQNNRIEELSPTGGFMAQWAVPPTDTLHSLHLLPRAAGGVLAVDPSGALLVYPPNGGAPVRRPLVLNGGSLPPGSTQLIGLASAPGGNLLVTDGNSGRVFVVPTP